MTQPAEPCPFCGSTQGSVVAGSTYRWRVYECSECQARGPEEARLDRIGYDAIENEKREAAVRAEALAAWNARNEPPQMTIRQQFVMAAMEGILASAEWYPFDKLAELSCAAADATLAEEARTRK